MARVFLFSSSFFKSSPIIVNTNNNCIHKQTWLQPHGHSWRGKLYTSKARVRWCFLPLILWEKGSAKQHGQKHNAEYRTVHNLHGKCLQSDASSSYIKNQPEHEGYKKIVLLESVQSIHVSKRLQFVVYIHLYLYIYIDLPLTSRKIRESLGIELLHDEARGPKNRRQGPEEEERIWGTASFTRCSHVWGVSEAPNIGLQSRARTSCGNAYSGLLLFLMLPASTQNTEISLFCPHLMMGKRRHDVRHRNKAMKHSWEFMSKQTWLCVCCLMTVFKQIHGERN